ncbi:MAG TPA: RIP metalloprotease RseP [Candidatus Cybelea sp.]|nr:RIP metalloprotease RseP [Candidatus Cybelea sp.]
MNTILGIVLVLGVMILVHEWGHFIVARLFGVRVDVFSIGFGPRLFGWKRGATDYRLSALPFGGYVRMAGQDLSEIDSSEVAPTGAPDELMSKPRWQRVLISAAGPAVNLIMPVLLLGGFFWIKGLPYPAYLDEPPAIASLKANDPLAKAGVVPGDRIVSVNGVATSTWEKVDEAFNELRPESSYRVSVEHEGVTREVPTSGNDLVQADAPGHYPMVAPIVSQPLRGMAAQRAGMKRGDLIVSVNGTKITSWMEFKDMILGSGGKSLLTVVKRDGQLVTLKLEPQSIVGEDGKANFRLGVGPEERWSYKKMTFNTAVENASVSTWYGLKQLLGVVGRLFSGKQSVKLLLGPVGIIDQAGQAVQEGSFAVINLMAIISLNLGILNLFPIPILDGGNILLLALESVRRRDFSLAFKERFVQVGLVLILVLFGYVMYNDVARFLPIHT